MNQKATDLHYMQLALQQADNAMTHGEVPVGALLITADGEHFAAHNAPITSCDGSAHAEMRVIRAACQATGNYRLNDSTLYVTLEPCCMCAGAMIHTRIKRLVYGADEPKTGAVNSLYQLLSDPRMNHQVEISSGLLADESAKKLKAFFKSRRKYA